MNIDQIIVGACYKSKANGRPVVVRVLAIDVITIKNTEVVGRKKKKQMTIKLRMVKYEHRDALGGRKWIGAARRMRIGDFARAMQNSCACD